MNCVVCFTLMSTAKLAYVRVLFSVKMLQGFYSWRGLITYLTILLSKETNSRQNVFCFVGKLKTSGVFLLLTVTPLGRSPSNFSLGLLGKEDTDDNRKLTEVLTLPCFLKKKNCCGILSIGDI